MKIIICGQPESTRRCRLILEKTAKDNAVGIEVAEMTSGKQLLFHLDEDRSDVDLIYLDYSLEDGTGIDTAVRLRRNRVKADIVFFTADEKHIGEGYDVEALHYLNEKTVSAQKFEEVFMKAAARAEERQEEVLSLFSAGENLKVEIGRIKYFEVNGRIVTVYYGKNDKFEFYSTMARLEEILFGKGFIRIHRAYLVAKKYIHSKTRQSIIMSDQAELPIGRSYQGKLNRI